ncbi:MAG: phosphoribosylformylglycinamidine synthase subunit PurQ, partial [Nitrospirae bacterium]|nr:phosphoribosylformylglycinamidine synthase subunit PurQ [Nitrospirota bacterium]
SYKTGQVLKMPIAHAMGNYYGDDNIIDDLLKNKQIIFRYCDDGGEVNDDVNPNGAMLNIAGITNKAGNVLGMMPHPERCVEDLTSRTMKSKDSRTDGLMLFESMLSSIIRTNL